MGLPAQAWQRVSATGPLGLRSTFVDPEVAYVAVRVTFTGLLTVNVVKLKGALLPPAGMLTTPGKISSLGVLERLTEAPPWTADPKDTVPYPCAFPVPAIGDEAVTVRGLCRSVVLVEQPTP